MIVVIAVVALRTPARAEPVARTYPQAMAEGERQMTARQFRAAAAAYAAALEARPQDARALAELSWAQLQAGELDRAEEAASTAIHGTQDRRLRAIAYYNLGRVHQARGDAVAAQAAYAASLDLRDHPDVRARLAQLAPRLFAPHRLAGPFGNPEDFCSSPCDVERAAESSTWRRAEPLGGPFRDAAMLVAEDPRGGHPRASVAVRFDDGWYVLADLGAAPLGHGGLHRAEVRTSGERLVVSWHAEVGRFGHHDERSLFVCGVGTAGAPSCVGPIVLEKATYTDRCGKDIDCNLRATYSVWFRCRAELRGDAVHITRSRAAIQSDDETAEIERPRPDICDALAITGTHALTF